MPPTPPLTTVVATRATTTSTPPGATATPSRPAASATPSGAIPNPIPAGWRTYRGTLPFTIAVPPDWTIEEQSAQGLIYFYAPTAERTTFMVLATTGQAAANPNLDVLRDQWYRSRTEQCRDFAIERTSQARYADIDFATVGATCDLPNGLAYSYTGIGLRQQVPWIFEFNAPYGDYNLAFATAFEPMIRSWTFDGAAGR